MSDLCAKLVIDRKEIQMTEFEIGKEYKIQDSVNHFSVGIVDKVTPKWIHIVGTYRTADKWILRDKIIPELTYKVKG